MVGLILWTENGWLLFETSNCPQLFAVKTLNETKNYRSKDERVGWETDTDKIQSEGYRDNYTRLSCLCILFHCLLLRRKVPFVNLIMVATMGAVLIKAKQNPERMPSRQILGQIIKIGFPSACETALYNVAMTLVVRFMNQMDTNGMNVTARSYTMQIANFSYCIGAALAQANAIMAGWRIGAKEFEECDRGTRKAALYGVITSACFSITFALTGRYLVHIFTDDPQMISLVVKLLIVDVFLEFGRVTNLVYGQALKTSGDAVFPVIMGAIFMYLCAVGGTYFFGIRLGLLAVGAYIALASDECARAVGMMLRWRSGKWKNKRLVE